jgi:hypothetical protein
MTPREYRYHNGIQSKRKELFGQLAALMYNSMKPEFDRHFNWYDSASGNMITAQSGPSVEIKLNPHNYNENNGN